MRKKRKVLWIEDGARSDFQNMLGPIYVKGEYDLIVALDATTAIAHLRKTEFDVVIVDIRITPGEDQKCRELYKRGHGNNVAARLGLDILYGLLAPQTARMKLEPLPVWISPERFAIFTVESRTQVQSDLNLLKINVFRQKTTETTSRTLLEIIEEVNHKGLSMR
jgi:hypothetical protein